MTDALQGNNNLPSVVRIADLERHRDELIYEKKRLEDLLNRTEALLASAKHGIHLSEYSTSQPGTNGHTSVSRLPTDTAERASNPTSTAAGGRFDSKSAANESEARSVPGHGDSSSSERDELESPPQQHEISAGKSSAVRRRNSFERRMASLPVMAALPLKRISPAVSDSNVDTPGSLTAPAKKATAWGIDSRSPSVPDRSKTATNAMDEDDDHWNWENLYGVAKLEKAGDWRGFARPLEDKPASQARDVVST